MCDLQLVDVPGHEVEAVLAVDANAGEEHQGVTLFAGFDAQQEREILHTTMLLQQSHCLLAHLRGPQAQFNRGLTNDLFGAPAGNEGEAGVDFQKAAVRQAGDAHHVRHELKDGGIFLLGETEFLLGLGALVDLLLQLPIVALDALRPTN